ncbi:MAG: hypothetical protein GF408_07680 [Candidatus Omnitrophica bacterium]|nr:hypothetical protein [Candidatus Omnitrophota bacterium]
MVMTVLRSKKVARRVLIGILILIIPAFVLWGVGNLSQRPAPIGTISGQKITADEFSKSLQGIKAQVLFTQFGDREAMNAILQNRGMMNWMAWERLVFLDAAEKAGVKITNNDVMSFIATHPLFQRNGTFDRKVYEYILTNNLSIEPRLFEELVRQNLMVRALRRAILKNVYVTEEEIAEYYSTSNSEVDLSYVMLEPASFTEATSVTDEEAKEYFKKNRFMTAPKAVVDYIELPYKNASEKQKAVGTLETLYPELASSPESFRQTAESRDLEVKRTQPFSEEEVVPGVPFFEQFNVTALSLEEGAVSTPLFSSGGDKGSAFVIHKIESIPPRPLEFEEVKTAVKNFLSERKRLLLAQEAAAKMYSRITDTGATLEEAAAEMNKSVKKEEDITISDYIENIGPSTEIVMAAVKNKEPGILDPINLQKGVILVRVDKIDLPDKQGLADKKEDIREQLLKRKQLIALENWFRDRSDRVKLNTRLDEI